MTTWMKKHWILTSIAALFLLGLIGQALESPESRAAREVAHAAQATAQAQQAAEHQVEREARAAERRIADLKVDAVLMAQKFMKNRLKAPATAEFQSFTDAEVNSFPGDEFKVSTYVDAQNAFGAKIRTKYIAHLKYIGDDKWTLVELVTDQDIERMLREAQRKGSK